MARWCRGYWSSQGRVEKGWSSIASTGTDETRSDTAAGETVDDTRADTARRDTAATALNE
jgi:hypothetical protein